MATRKAICRRAKRIKIIKYIRKLEMEKYANKIWGCKNTEWSTNNVSMCSIYHELVYIKRHREAVKCSTCANRQSPVKVACAVYLRRKIKEFPYCLGYELKQ